MKINKLEVLLKVGLCKIFRKNNDLQAKSLKKSLRMYTINYQLLDF